MHCIVGCPPNPSDKQLSGSQMLPPCAQLRKPSKQQGCMQLVALASAGLRRALCFILQAMLGYLSAQLQLLWTRCRFDHISPHSPIATGSFGLFPGLVATFSIFLTTRRPSPRTRPNTTCLLSSQSVFAQVMKNWQPFVLGPEFC